MERITDDKIKKATLAPVGYSRIAAYRAVAYSQLQSDKTTVRECRERVAEIIDNALRDDWISGEYNSKPYVDQIIKILISDT